MNTNDNELEDMLGSQLTRRAGDVRSPGVSLSAVHQRAGRIRRRRRAVAGAGVAAVLAIAIPVAVNIGDVPNPKNSIDLAPAPPKVSRTTLSLAGLERGEDSRLEFFTADGVMLADGLQELSESWQAMIPRTGGGWLALGPSREEVLEVSPDFEPTLLAEINQRLVSDPERSLVAWVAPGQSGQTLTTYSTADSTLTHTWDLPATPSVEPVDFAGADSVVFQTVGRSGGTQSISLAHPDGTTRLLSREWVKAISANPRTGLIAVQTTAKPDASGCFGVVDPAAESDQPLWQTCDHSLGAFSPDGRFVLASDPYQSGLGITSLSVLEASTGDLVAEFTQPQGGQLAVNNVAWESDSSILGVAIEGMDSTMVRFGIDGSLARVGEPVAGDPMSDQAFYLSADLLRGY